MEKTFKLRYFQPSDLSKVMHINRVCLPENYTSFFFLDLYKRFPLTFLVAEENNSVVGYIMCRMETGFPSFGLFGFIRKGHIVSIAVLPEHRRKGIGHALVVKAMENMEKYNAKECYLEVRISNTPAINLYRKLGFQITKTIPAYYVDGENAYLMARKLPLEEKFKEGLDISNWF